MNKKSYNSIDTVEYIGYQLGCFVIVLMFNVVLGGFSINYLLEFFLNANIPFIADALIGMFTAELTVPIWIVMKILEAFGVI